MNPIRKIGILGFDDWFFIANLMSIMKKNSEKITLIAPINFNISPKITKGYRILTFGNYHPGKLTQIIPCLVGILRILAREKFDLIHVPSNRPFWFFLIIIFIRFYLRVKLAIFVHEPFRREGDTSTGLSYNYPEVFCETQFSNYLLFGGKAMLNDFKIKGRTSANLIECGLGVFSYLNEIYQEEKLRNPGQILFFGRIEKYKGLDVLIESLKYVHQKYQLIVAGKGQIRRTSALALLIRQNKVKIFNDYIDDNFMYELFSTSGIVVVPYLTGTQSAVISNSFAFNTPVIATKVGSIHEIVNDGKTGFIIDPGDPEQLAERLNIILNNTKMQNDMAKNIEVENQKINAKIKRVLQQIYFI